MVDEGDWNDYSLGSAYYCRSTSFANKIALVLVLMTLHVHSLRMTATALTTCMYMYINKNMLKSIHVIEMKN